jgi:trimeric autotransporter adhesin
MKKYALTSFFALFFSVTLLAQLTGSKTIPGDYPTIAAAIADLNTFGVGGGGVTFNVAAGHAETFTLPSDGTITTPTSSSSNPVSFVKSGSGANPLITAAPGTGTTDAIITIAGSDHITFNGINLMENVANVTATTQAEWGYAILKASATDGSQNITIRNCNISLTVAYNLTIGIYANNHLPGINTQLVVTSTTGANSNLKVYNDTISNSYSGIYFAGFNDPTAPYQYFDQNNEIGKDGANFITNVAGGTSAGYGIYTIYQNNLKVANNRVTSTMGGTQTAYGIYLAAARNASYDLYNNFVSLQFSGTGGSANLYAIFCEMGGNGTTNTVNVYGNTVAGCTYPTVTTASTRLLHMLNTGVNVNVYGNTIINNTIGSSSTTAAGQVHYLYTGKSSTTPGPLTVYGNLVDGNAHIQSAPGNSTQYYLAVASSGTNLSLDFYDNAVTNNIAGTSGTTYGLYVYFENAAKNVYNNLVSNITGASGTFYGIYHSGSSSNTGISRFFQNTIRDVEGNLATTNISAIYHSSGSNSPFYYYNNFISDLRAPLATRTSAPFSSVYGFNISSGNIVYIYNNSVYLNASSTGANFGSASVYVNTSSRVDIRNNNFVNVSVPNGSGKTNGLYFSSTNIANYLYSSNFNNIYSGTPGSANVLYNDGTNIEQELTGLRARLTPREIQTVTELPPFINISTKPYDLRINGNIPSQCEAGGSIIGAPVPVINDFDGNPRFPNAGYPVHASFTPNAPDIGADEFGGIANDITVPAIVYTPLSDTNISSPRTLVASITDGSGVPVSGIGLPVLYWRINADPYQAAQGIYISGNNYSFTFGQGTVSGDLVSYYIAAQDNAPTPNVGTYAYYGASGFSSNPPACSTAPYSPDEYEVVPSISGVFHVGVGKDYTTLTEAAVDINEKWIAAPVTLILDDPTYPSESFPIFFRQNPGSSSVNTLTIRPNAGNTALISGSLNQSIIELQGIDYITIDGSNNGSDSKNLTIQNTSIVTGATGIQVSSFGGVNPATNFTIKNSVIQCTPVHSSVVSIVGIRFSNTGGPYTNIKIHNNTIKGAFDAIALMGSATYNISDVEITNNIIGSENASEYVTRIGVYLQYTNNILIRGNDIMGPAEGSFNVGQTGVYIGTLSKNTKIQRNKIHGFVRTADDGWGVSGIWFSSDATTVTEISNNQIYDIRSPGINPGVGQNITYGIFVRSGGNIHILHNSIYLTGQISTLYDASSACIGFYYQATGNNNKVVNNILRNSMTYTGGPGGSGRPYGIMVSTSPAALFTQIDYNDYFIDGTNGYIAQHFANGLGIVAEFPTLASWQAATLQDANSMTIDPMFSSPTHLLPTNSALNNLGIFIPGVPVDYTGAQRSNPADIGAFEFGNDPLVITLTANSITTNSATITGSTNPAGATVNTYFDWGLTNSYGNIATATPSVVSGSNMTPIQTPLTGLDYGTTYHYRARVIRADGLIAYGADSVFTTLPLAPSVITTAATDITEYSASLNGTVNPNGGFTTVTFEWGLTTSYGNTFAATPGSINGFVVIDVTGTIADLTPYTTYHFRVTATNASGTIYGNDMEFTTSPIPASVITNLATDILGFNATLNGTINANYAPTNATFEWGLTTSYGNIITGNPSIVTGFSPTAVSAILTDLIPATEYHFRCVGTGPGGTIYGEDMMFISDCPTPGPAGQITGQQDVCVNETGVVYSIDPIYLATGYNWTVPSGATITGGSNTNSITVTFTTTAVNGNITVNGTNSCGIGNSSSLPVVVHQLPVATITGSSEGCQGSFDNLYSTEPGMNDYSWTVTGGTIDEGAGTNAISVTWNNSGSQTVSVTYASTWGCYVASPATMNVLVGNLDAPVIIGDNMNCINATNAVYTTDAGFTNYQWTITSGGQIVSGQGTYQVEVNWVGSGNQTITVIYSTENGCYPVNPTGMNVNIIPVPAAPGAITGTPELCAGSENVTYSVLPVPNATNYTWNLPYGATIVDGEYTNMIKVDFAQDATSGNITVIASNNCGAGPASPNYSVTVNPIPATPVITIDENNMLHSSAPEGNQWYFNGDLIPGATGQDYQATEEGSYWTIVTLENCSSDESNHIEVIFTGLGEIFQGSVNVYPVPNKGRFTVSVEIPGEETFTINVYNEMGIRVFEMRNFHVDGKAQQYIDLLNPATGMYTLVLSGNHQTTTRKLFVSK